MKQIKAFVHRRRVGDLVHALEEAGFRRLSLFDVKGVLQGLTERELDYSVDLGERILNEVQIELFCEDAQVERAISTVRANARTGGRNAGWIYVSDVAQAIEIAGEARQAPEN
ncbi:P-II family nitrogen regulator [Luteimonas aquatica]|uniref:P-II family nitrogen regulator n=1 Tax=Luteimonas aquatica TaxID=450364 RepID=UPI001F57FA18|nr:P-II family nitrogen regulator [Luteimonas aquatica]